MYHHYGKFAVVDFVVQFLGIHEMNSMAIDCLVRHFVLREKVSSLTVVSFGYKICEFPQMIVML